MFSKNITASTFLPLSDEIIKKTGLLDERERLSHMAQIPES